MGKPPHAWPKSQSQDAFTVCVKTGWQLDKLPQGRCFPRSTTEQEQPDPFQVSLSIYKSYHPSDLSRLSQPLVLLSWLFSPWHSVLFFPFFSHFSLLPHFRNDFAALTCPEAYHCLEMVAAPKGKGSSKVCYSGLLRHWVCFHFSFSSAK